MGENANGPIAGVSRENIPTPRLFRPFCVGCEKRQPFSPADGTESGLTYTCDECGHAIELDLNPEQ